MQFKPGENVNAFLLTFGIVGLICGLVLAFAGALMRSAKKPTKRMTQPVKGQVVNVDYRIAYTDRDEHGAKEYYAYFPTYRYTLDGQNYIETELSYGYKKKLVGEGDIVDLLVDPEHPQKFAVVGESATIPTIAYYAGIILAVFGVVCLVANFIV